MFDRPSATLRRKARRACELENGKRLFEPAEILAILAAVSIPLKAMVLLGINGGFGNADCARLPLTAVDLEKNIIEFDRPKTGVERIVPLWPETSEALRAALAKRPATSDEDSRSLVFLTTFGRPWVRQKVHRNEANGVAKVIAVDAIGQEFNKTLTDLELSRTGLGFYALRHTFRTWADEVHDQHAIHRIMGHAIPGMSGVYVEEISLDRLRAVTDHVRSKIFPEKNRAFATVSRRKNSISFSMAMTKGSLDEFNHAGGAMTLPRGAHASWASCSRLHKVCQFGP